jgi:branched-subunit amino acid ABC-type transport system permease component
MILEGLAKTTLLGVEMGMTLVLVTVGLTLIFGMMDVINFAHGSLYMLGAYFGLTLVSVTGNWWLALLAAPLLVGLLGGLIEYFTIRPLYGRNPLYHILLTFGFAILLHGLVTEIWGGQVQNIETPDLLSGSVDLVLFSYPLFRVFLLCVSIAVTAALWVAIRRSDFGIVMRASAHDSEMVDALGTDVSRVFTAVFVLGSVLAGLAGVLLGTSQAVDPGMAASVIIQAFAIVVIGGLGSYRGAVVGAFVVGMLNAFGPTFAPQFTDALLYLLMAAVLLIKPAGLFGNPEGA